MQTGLGHAVKNLLRRILLSSMIFFYIYQVMFSVKVRNISKSYRRSSIMMGHTIHFWSYTQVIAIPIFHSSKLK